MKTKICTQCKQKKTHDKFHKNKTRKDGLHSSCLACEQIRRLGYYGINGEQYKELFNAQNGCCAICKKHQSKLKQRLHIDHDHETGIIRGLLCKRCNSTIDQYIAYPKEFEKYLKTVALRMIKFYRKWLE